jgi:inorganic triphosphatase YgiF
MPAESTREIEATLIICSEDPLPVVASVGAIPSVAGNPLLAQDPVYIQDYYVDTPGGVLRFVDFSLRVREINTSSWLTLKGPPTPLAHGLVERMEMELPWSEDSLVRICDELGHHGVQFSPVPNSHATLQPSEVLTLMGLEKVQYRENHRQIRNISQPHGDRDLVLAELGIDSVVYHFETLQVHHYEVEVEAKSEEGIEVLPAVIQGLAEAYPTTLQKWDHGKLSTGRAVEALLTQESFAGLVNRHGQLMPAAYPEIHRFLEQQET